MQSDWKQKDNNKAKVLLQTALGKLRQEHYTEATTASFCCTQQSADVPLLPHGRQREFLAWDGQIGPVILGASIDSRLTASCYVMSHMSTSTIWDVIPYQRLSRDSQPLCFLTPHLVPINNTCVLWWFLSGF
jgi:hypothetical protein